MGAALLVAFRFRGLPWLAQAFIAGMIVCGLLFSLETALYRLRVSDAGISEFRFGWRHYAWTDVVGWTRWGDGNLLFIKTANGRIIGTGRPGFGEGEIVLLADLLSAKAGPMARGDQSVLPWYLERTFGGLMRSEPDR